jgi:hypothetical protein
MRARTRLAAGALTTLGLLGGGVACSGEAPDRAEEGINEDLDEGEQEDADSDE